MTQTPTFQAGKFAIDDFYDTIGAVYLSRPNQQPKCGVKVPWNS